MPESSDNAGGIIASARRLGRSFLGLITTRLELVSIELQEEKLRALRLLAWLAVFTSLALVSLMVAVGTLALFLWHSTGYAGLVVLATSLLILSAGSFALLRRRVSQAPAPFADTIAEFKKDMTCLPHDS